MDAELPAIPPPQCAKKGFILPLFWYHDQCHVYCPSVTHPIISFAHIMELISKKGRTTISESIHLNILTYIPSHSCFSPTWARSPFVGVPKSVQDGRVS